MNDDDPIRRRAAMIDRERLKRGPSAGRKLQKTACAITRLVPATFLSVQPCLARWNGAKSAFSSWHPRSPGSNLAPAANEAPA
jgi:hypothetical protein